MLVCWVFLLNLFFPICTLMCAQYIGHAPTKGCVISHMFFGGWVLKKVSSAWKKKNVRSIMISYVRKEEGKRENCTSLHQTSPLFGTNREENISPLLHWAAPKCNAFFLPSALRGSLFFVHWLRHEASLIRIEKSSIYFFPRGQVHFKVS